MSPLTRLPLEGGLHLCANSADGLPGLPGLLHRNARAVLFFGVHGRGCS